MEKVRMKPVEIAAALESQVDECLQMYAVAEKAYAYENTHPETFKLNEHY